MKFIESTCLLFKKEELLSYLKCTDIKKLKLDEQERIGYTFKSLGAAFWAFKQKDFRKAITKIVMQVHEYWGQGLRSVHACIHSKKKITNISIINIYQNMMGICQDLDTW